MPFWCCGSGRQRTILVRIVGHQSLHRKPLKRKKHVWVISARFRALSAVGGVRLEPTSIIWLRVGYAVQGRTPPKCQKIRKTQKVPERGRKRAFSVTTHISRISAQNLRIQRRKTVENTENCTVFLNLYWGRLRHAPVPRLSRAV